MSISGLDYGQHPPVPSRKLHCFSGTSKLYSFRGEPRNENSSELCLMQVSERKADAIGIVTVVGIGTVKRHFHFRRGYIPICTSNRR